MLLKWIFLFAIAYIAYRYWSRVSVKHGSTRSASNVERMLECAHCGLRFPEGEAVRSEGEVFCSEQHYLSWKQNH